MINHIDILLKTIEKIVSKKIELNYVLEELTKALNSKRSKVIILATGLTGFMMEDMIKSFSYLFKFDNKRLIVYIPGKDHSDLWSGEDWRHLEKEGSVGALDALETDLKVGDVIINFTSTEKTDYVNSFLKEAKVHGAKTILISSADKSSNKLDSDFYVNIPVENPMVKNLYIGNHSTVHKAIAEWLFLEYFNSKGQIVNNNVLTMKLWTGRLREIAFETLSSIFEDFEINEFNKLCEESDGEMAVIYLMKAKKCSVDKAKDTLLKTNFNIEEALKLV